MAIDLFKVPSIIHLGTKTVPPTKGKAVEDTKKELPTYVYVRAQVFTAGMKVRISIFLTGVALFLVAAITFILAYFGDEFQKPDRIGMAILSSLLVGLAFWQIVTSIAKLEAAAECATKSYEEERRAHEGTYLDHSCEIARLGKHH